MIAVDNNVVLRLILADDERQLAAIRALMARETLFVSLTVLLEVGWVLASRYRLPRAAVAQALTSIEALEGVHVARRDLVGWAIERYRSGADWADMVHIVGASKVGSFATLDRDLHRRAASDAAVSIELLA